MSSPRQLFGRRAPVVELLAKAPSLGVSPGWIGAVPSTGAGPFLLPPRL